MRSSGKPFLFESEPFRQIPHKALGRLGGCREKQQMIHGGKVFAWFTTLYLYGLCSIIVILPIRGYFLFFLTIIYTLCQLNFSLCLNRQNQCFAILLVSNSYNSFRFTEINVVVKTKLAVSVCSRASLYDIYNVQ